MKKRTGKIFFYEHNDKIDFFFCVVFTTRHFAVRFSYTFMRLIFNVLKSSFFLPTLHSSASLLLEAAAKKSSSIHTHTHTRAMGLMRNCYKNSKPEKCSLPYTYNTMYNVYMVSFEKT